MVTKTGTKDRTVQALMGLLLDAKQEALSAGHYEIEDKLNHASEEARKAGRTVKSFTAKEFDNRNKKAAFTSFSYVRLTKWTIPHLQKAIQRLQPHLVKN